MKQISQDNFSSLFAVNFDVFCHGSPIVFHKNCVTNYNFSPKIVKTANGVQFPIGRVASG